MAQLLGDGGGLPLSADLIDRGVDSLSREQMIELLVTMQLKAIEQENINDVRSFHFCYNVVLRSFIFSCF